MTKTDLLRKLIREEVIKALRQELPGLIKEVKSSSPIVENKRPTFTSGKVNIPATLNTPGSRKPPVFAGSNPLANLLNDTAKSMITEDFSMTTDQVHPSMAFQPKEDKVTSVEGMLGSARKSSNVDAVQINEVPDFSALMNKMKEKGQI